MSDLFDIAVLGAGPAGMAAATEAASRGARVVLLEESPAPGGQVYRSPPPGFVVPADADSRIGNMLRTELAASGATIRTGCRVWAVGGGPLVAAGAEAQPFRLDALGSDGVPFAVTARALVLCTGTHERIIPFPGWTLPGVRQACASAPSTRSTHCWQMPIMQNTLRGRAGSRPGPRMRKPSASRAAARLSPGCACIGRPSTVMVTGGGRWTEAMRRSVRITSG